MALKKILGLRCLVKRAPGLQVPGSNSVEDRILSRPKQYFIAVGLSKSSFLSHIITKIMLKKYKTPNHPYIPVVADI